MGLVLYMVTCGIVCGFGGLLFCLVYADGFAFVVVGLLDLWLLWLVRGGVCMVEFAGLMPDDWLRVIA